MSPRSYMIFTTTRVFFSPALRESSWRAFVISVDGSEYIQKLVARNTSLSALEIKLDMCRAMSGMPDMMTNGQTPLLPISDGEQTSIKGSVLSVPSTSWYI